MFKTKELAKAVRFALLGGAVATAMTSLPVLAAEGDDVERIEVTGSRIKRTDIEGANPVTVIDRDSITAMGVTNVGELIQKLPAMSGSPIGTTTNNGGSGAVTVDLRGMGSIRTLVLVNGRRTVDGGDFQTIPASMIERVEILKDGASAIYGADAVSGVVNVITRKDFEGVEVAANREIYTEAGSAKEDTVSLISGKTWNSGNVVFGFDYAEQQGVLQGETDTPHFQSQYWIMEADARNCFACEGNYYSDIGYNEELNMLYGGSSRIPNGYFRMNKDSAYFPGGANVTYDPTLGDASDPNAYRRYTGADAYNYSPVNYIQTPYEKINAFVEGQFDVADNVKFFSALRANKRNSAQQLAPTPYSSDTDPGYQVAIRDAEGNVTGYSNGISADNIYNPFGEDIIQVRRRIVEGARRFEQDVLQVQALAGFSGVVKDVWEWEASYNYGYRARTDVDYGQMVGARLENALGPSFVDDNGNAVCGTPDAPIDGCVPLNLFGAGSITQEMMDYVSADLVDKYTSQQDVVTGIVSNSELFELPAGFVGASFGYEYRREAYNYTPDSGKATNAVTGNSGEGVDGAYWANSFFAEGVVPILEGKPAAELLEATLGLRYDDFSSFGGNTTYQGALKWKPIDDLLLRTTYGTVFRAPTVDELYAGQQDSFQQATDPCNTDNFAGLSAEGQARCLADGVPAGGADQPDSQLPAKIGGNTELTPEEGDTFTIGLAYAPSYLEGLNLTLDYWSIEIEDVIDSLSADSKLDLCYAQGVTSQCDGISRFSDGAVSEVVVVNQNLARRKAEGIDTELTYAFDTNIGSFKAFVGWTHLLTRSDWEYEGAEETDIKGIYDARTYEAFPEDKINMSLDYSWNDLSVTYGIEYIGGITSAAYLNGEVLNDAGDVFDYTQDVDAVWYHDIAFAYDFPTDTRARFGVSNIFDEEAPFIDAGFNASTAPETYRVMGRSVFFGVTQKF